MISKKALTRSFASLATASLVIMTGIAGGATSSVASVARSASAEPATNDAFFSAAPPAVNDGEREARDVDEAALSAQQAAAQNLQSVAAKYRGNPTEEPAYLFRLADILQQKAQMDFRVGHGKVLLPSSAAKRPQLQGYQRDMQSSVEALDRLLSKYPSFEDAPRALFMRGRAHEELGHVAPAAADYQSLLRRAPQAPEATPARMSLAEFAAVAGHHAQAIDYLKPLERKTSDPYYPFALYKMAWSYYNLAQFPSALAYSERLVAYYSKRANQGEAVAASRALRESILKDVPVFFYGGYEAGKAGYSPADALAYFKKLSPGEAGAADRGQMIALYGKLLRSADRQKDLVAWKALVIASEGNRSESFELLLTTFEYQLNQSRYEDLIDTARDIVKAHRTAKGPGVAELRTRAEKLAFDGASRIQARMVKETQKTAKAQDDEYVHKLSNALAALYGCFAQMVDEADPRLRSVHFNLAETLFSIKEYERAAANYRWIVEHGSWSENERTPKEKTGGITVREASIKSIASRYETLRARSQAGQEIKARAFPAKERETAPAPTAEWLAWIDLHVEKTGQTIDNFQFEANRALYGQGRVRQAVARLRAFAMGHPKSQYAVPSATLVLDTYIASSDWQNLAALARDLSTVPAWKGTPFAGKVSQLAADAHFKQAQTLAAHKDYDAAIEQAESLTSNYGTAGAHAADSFALAGDAALAKKDPDLAIRYYGKLAASAPRSEKAGKAYLAMAKVEEERYGFASAARYYREYLGLPLSATHLGRSSMTELKVRTLTLAWLGQDPSQLHAFVNDRGLCAQASGDCTRIRALLPLLSESVPPAVARRAALSARMATRETRAIWAAVALDRPESLSSRDRRAMIDILSTYWKQTEALARFALLPRVTSSVPRAFALERQAVSAGRLSASAASITGRLRRVQDLEAFASKAASLPWVRVRALVLSEVAQSYTDYSAALRALPAPRKLSAAARGAYDQMVARTAAPFDQKAQGLRAQALGLASKPAADEIAVSQVGDAALKSGYPASRLPRVSVAALDLSFLRAVDPQGDWSNDATPDTRGEALRSAWTRALDRGNWPQVGFFMQEAREKHVLTPIALASARAVSLAQAGAPAEGRLELSPYCHALPDDLREGCPRGGAAPSYRAPKHKSSPPSRLARSKRSYRVGSLKGSRR